MTSVLIVDDEPSICNLIRRLLEKEGYTTRLSSNGKEAVKEYTSNPPDLVITDIVMPDKEGLETIMELKRIDPEVKIIAISGGGSLGPIDYLNLAKKLGSKEVLEKPIDRNELLHKINAVLSDKEKF